MMIYLHIFLLSDLNKKQPPGNALVIRNPGDDDQISIISYL